MNPDGDPCKQLAALLIAEHPVSAELCLDLPACSVRVRSNSAALLDVLRRNYGEHVAAAPHSDANHEIIALVGETPALPWPSVPHTDEQGRETERWYHLADGRIAHRREYGMTVVLSDDVDMICGPLNQHPLRVARFINDRVLAAWLVMGGLSVHAAGVVRGGKALLFSGHSGAGKTTLSLEVFTADPEVAMVTNDRGVIVVDDGGPRIFGSPKHASVNPGTILNNPALASLITAEQRRSYRALPAEQLRTLDVDHKLVISTVFGRGRVRLEAPIGGMVFLCWSPDADAPLSIKPVDLASRPDLQAILHQRTGRFHWPGAQRPKAEVFAALAAALSGVPVYLISGRTDFHAAARWAGERLAEDL